MIARGDAPSFRKGGLGRNSATLKYQPKLKSIVRVLKLKAVQELVPVNPPQPPFKKGGGGVVES